MRRWGSISVLAGRQRRFEFHIYYVNIGLPLRTDAPARCSVPREQGRTGPFVLRCCSFSLVFSSFEIVGVEFKTEQTI